MGPSTIVGVEQVTMVFVGGSSSWTSQYVPNSNLQCFVKSSFYQYTILHGDSVSDTPAFARKAFSHSTT